MRYASQHLIRQRFRRFFLDKMLKTHNKSRHKQMGLHQVTSFYIAKETTE